MKKQTVGIVVVLLGLLLVVGFGIFYIVRLSLDSFVGGAKSLGGSFEAAQIIPNGPVESLSFRLEGEQIYKIDGGIETAAGADEASLSQDRKSVAYTIKRPGEWGSDPYIYFYNLDSKETTRLPIANQEEMYIGAWFKNDTKLLVINYPQATGEVQAYIYDIGTQKVQQELTLYDTAIAVINNKLIYSVDAKSCYENPTCQTESLRIYRYDGEKQMLLTNLSYEVNNQLIVDNYSYDAVTQNLKISYKLNNAAQERGVNVPNL